LPASLLGLSGYWLAGLWTLDVTRCYLWTLPPVLAAAVLGRAINRRMTGRSFLRYVHLGLLVVGAVLPHPARRNLPHTRAARASRLAPARGGHVSRAARGSARPRSSPCPSWGPPSRRSVRSTPSPPCSRPAPRCSTSERRHSSPCFRRSISGPCRSSRAW